MPSLIFKEWHEQSWKLAMGCVVLGALAAIGLRSRILADETMILWVCFIGITLLPVLVSSGLIAPERSDGTFETLLSLPIRPWKILLAKTLAGMILCAAPLALAAALSILIAGGREVSTAWMLALYGRSIFSTLALFIWMLAATSRLTGEARAALTALGILIIWSLATGGIDNLLWNSWGHNRYDDYRDYRDLMSASPLALVYENNAGVYDMWGVFRPLDTPSQLYIDLLIQVFILLTLWLLTLRFFVAPVEEQP